jgi:hypothetical protein
MQSYLCPRLISGAFSFKKKSPDIYLSGLNFLGDIYEKQKIFTFTHSLRNNGGNIGGFTASVF